MAKPTRAFAPVMVGQAAASGSLSVAAPFGAGTSAQRLVRVYLVQVGAGLAGDTLPTPTIGGVALTPIGPQLVLSGDQGIARRFGLAGASIPGSNPAVAVTGANINRRLQMCVLGYEGATQCLDGDITSITGTPVAWTVADADSDADSIVDVPLISTHQTAAGGNTWTAPLPAVAGASGATVLDQATSYLGCYRQLVVQADAAASGATLLGLSYTNSQYGASESIGPVLVVRGVAAGGDTTAPTLSSPTGTGGTLSATGTVSTNEAGGTLYYLASANATETAPAQGSAMTGWASQAVTAVGAQNVTATGLTAGTRYLHYVHDDAAGNRSARVSSAGFTVLAGGAGGTITSRPLVRNTGTAATDAWALWAPGQAFTAYVHHPTTGALLVKRTGLLTNAAAVLTFTDAAVPVAPAYRVDFQHEATGVWGMDILPAV